MCTSLPPVLLVSQGNAWDKLIYLKISFLWYDLPVDIAVFLGTYRLLFQLTIDGNIFQKMTLTYGLGDQHGLFEPMRAAGALTEANRKLDHRMPVHVSR